MNMLLECRDIEYQYPNTEYPVFNHLSFSITDPGFHALFGPSGVGKTSLAKILINSIESFSGKVIREGMDQILYTYNLERLPDWSSVGRHLEKVTPPGRTDIKDDLIDFFGIQHIIDSRFSNLSLGQKNRVNLIRYLIQDFRMIIMDESLANVDERMREEIILKIKELFADRCFLYISHNIAEVSRFCKQITVLRSAHRSPQAISVAGQDQFDGTPLEKKAVEKTMLEVMNAS
jgi:ABC-type multidrug transport system ATPase subunit